MNFASNLPIAAPYLAGTAIAAAAGIYLACATAAVVAGVALAILGGYTFVGALSATLLLPNPSEFEEAIFPCMLKGVPQLIASLWGAIFSSTDAT